MLLLQPKKEEITIDKIKGTCLLFFENGQNGKWFRIVLNNTT